MPQIISLTNENQRDASVSVASPVSTPAPKFQDKNGNPVKIKRFVKLPETCSYINLLRKFGNHDLAVEALIESDPELDLLNTGRSLGKTNRVYVRQDGTLLHSTHFLELVTDPQGQEISRKPFLDVEATLNEDSPLRYSGKLYPKAKVLSSFALVRVLQLRHVNGLTYDFLYEIAKNLHEQDNMLFVSAGKNPLILQRNGKPYRGFLEGRIEDNKYRLLLFLSNLELKKI